MRPLTVFQPIDAGRARLDLATEPAAWLPAESRPTGPGAWMVPLRLGSITRTVRCEIGEPIRVGRTVWRRMRWIPVAEETQTLPAEKVLPGFDGEIGLHATADGVTLVLNGSYEVPLGMIGQTADAVVMNRAARSTATRFLGEVAERGAVQPKARPLTSAASSRSQ